MSSGLSELGIIAATLQSVLYGGALMMFIITMYILLHDHGRRRLNRFMIITSNVLIVLATMELAVNIHRLRNGLLTKGPKRPDGSEGYFGDVTEITYMVKGALYNVQTLILDAVVIYRAYVVWQKWSVVLIPGLGWCGLLASIIGLNYALATVPVDATDVFAFAAHTQGWITAVYATTLATNVTATGLLAYRIWSVNRRASEFLTSNRLKMVLHIVLESGLIYSVTIVVALVAFLASSRISSVLLDLISPIISIVFNMIIVRVGLSNGGPGLSLLGIKTSTIATTDVEHSGGSRAAGRPHHFRGRSEPGPGMELKSMTVVLHSNQEIDNGSIDGQEVKVMGTLGTTDPQSALRKLRTDL
ncbi:hypothetical protein BXZ70DRAFT_657842 [Cristinia sonorae]|uniref:Uncharacterized protein n=1 Tax=Cristinia sonorae TaxID=1940300 RepID=A0A8K0XK33_9AGAR|nr:hypothetical protein BXZ70DRAFT_657842 [Cristinia sonorae]